MLELGIEDIVANIVPDKHRYVYSKVMRSGHLSPAPSRLYIWKRTQLRRMVLRRRGLSLPLSIALLAPIPIMSDNAHKVVKGQKGWSNSRDVTSEPNEDEDSDWEDEATAQASLPYSKHRYCSVN